MTAIWIILAIAFVLVVLAWLAYGFFKVSPFAHHSDQYRDALTGRRIGESPHLETRDEFEHRTAT